MCALYSVLVAEWRLSRRLTPSLRLDIEGVLIALSLNARSLKYSLLRYTSKSRIPEEVPSSSLTLKVHSLTFSEACWLRNRHCQLLNLNLTGSIFLLQRTVFYPSGRNQIKVKLFDAFMFSLASDQAHGEPILKHQTLEGSTHGLLEEAFTFEVLKHHQYLLMIYHQGELNHDASGRELCEYYSLMLSFNSLPRVLSELTCLPSSSLKKQLTPWSSFLDSPVRDQTN